MSQYSHYTYCLQEESTDSSLSVLTHFGLDVTRQFGTENHQKKRRKIQQNSQSFFELYELFMNNVLFQNVLKSSFYMLRKLS